MNYNLYVINKIITTPHAKITPKIPSEFIKLE